MSDLAAVQLPRRLGEVPVGGWTAIIAVWLSRGYSFDKLSDSLRIRKKLMQKDPNLILADNQWTDKCFRISRKEDRHTRAEEKVKKEAREESKGHLFKLTARKRRERRHHKRENQQHTSMDSEERFLNAEQNHSAPVFRTHATQPIIIHI